MQSVDVPDRRRDLLVTPAMVELIPVETAADPLAVAITAITTRWRAGELCDASFAAMYFLHWQIQLYGRRVAARRFKHDAHPDPAL